MSRSISSIKKQIKKQAICLQFYLKNLLAKLLKLVLSFQHHFYLLARLAIILASEQTGQNINKNNYIYKTLNCKAFFL